MATPKKKKPATQKKKRPAAKPATRRLPPPPPAVPQDQVAFDKAQAALSTGALGEATYYAERAMLINPRRTDILAFLTGCWVKRGDQARALDYARQATELEPSNPHWWSHLGSAHFQLRQFPEAKEAYLRAISANPDFAQAYYNLAKAELCLGDNQAAAAHLGQALSLRKDMAEAARRDFSSLAGIDALAEWLTPPGEPGAGKPKGKKKVQAKPKAKTRKR